MCFSPGNLDCNLPVSYTHLMQIDANFINDYFDYLKGSDREDRLGPERACAQGWITLNAMRKGIAPVSYTHLSLNSSNTCAKRIQTLVYILISPVYLLYIVYAAYTVSTHCRYQQSNTGTDIG